MSLSHQSKFINILNNDKRLNFKEFNLKRKRNCIEDDNDNDEEDNDLNDLETSNNINTSDNLLKYIKKDVILSDYNVKTYNNPLIIDNLEYRERIEKKLNLLHQNNYIHLNNFKRVNNNIKFLFRNNSKQFNDLNTKLDLLNTKINTLNKELINNTHKMCVKIQSLENLIKNNEIKKVKK